MIIRKDRWAYGKTRLDGFCVDCKLPLPPGSMAWRDKHYSKEAGRRVCESCMRRRQEIR